MAQQQVAVDINKNSAFAFDDCSRPEHALFARLLTAETLNFEEQNQLYDTFVEICMQLLDNCPADQKELFSHEIALFLHPEIKTKLTALEKHTFLSLSLKNTQPFMELYSALSC